MLKILCYGDSNTWGQQPSVWKKHPKDLIWTTRLQNMLGSRAKILAEGLCGRTAGNIDLERPFHNGLEHFLSHAYTQYPFEVLLIALGTNDLQAKFNRSAVDIYQDLIAYQDQLKFMEVDDGIQGIKLFFMTPPMLLKDTESGAVFEGAGTKIEKLRNLLLEKSSLQSYRVIDLTTITVNSTDGLHFTSMEHEQVALTVYKSLLE